jgi:hypothetical protein
MVICGTVAIAWTAAQPSPSGERGVQERYAAVAFDFFALFSPTPSCRWSSRLLRGRDVNSRTSGEHGSSSTAGCGRSPDLTAILTLKVARQVAGYV